MSSRPRLLAVLDRFPYPAHDGVAYPIAGHLQGLAQWWDIDLLLVRRPGRPPVAVPAEHPLSLGCVSHVTAPAAGRLERVIGECLAGRPYAYLPIADERTLRELVEGKHYDAVYAAPLHVVYWAEALAKLLPQRPRLVLNINDSISEKFRRDRDLARITGLELRTRLWHAVRASRICYIPRLERMTLGMFDLILVQTPRDRQAILADCGESFADKLCLAPNGIKEELLSLDYGAAEDRRLVHIGALAGNRRDLLMWFVKHVYGPLVEKLPRVSLHLAGAITPRDRQMLESMGSVVVHGFVQRLEDVLQRATMSIAPMFMRTGLINKNLDSMAAGVPCSGIKAYNGITGFENGVHGFEVRSADEWVRLLTETLQDAELLRRVSADGRELVKKHFRWHNTVQGIHERMMALVDSSVT